MTANALIGVHRSLVYHTRERLLADAGDPDIGRDVLAAGPGPSRRSKRSRGLRDQAVSRRRSLLL